MSRHVTHMTLDDAEHISPEKRAQIIASYPPHEVEARTKGVPTLGSGRIYPVTEESITVEAFDVPRHWCLIGGLDFGWDHPTAGVKIAWDRDADVVYVCNTYRRREATPIEHVSTLKEWGGFPWAWGSEAYQRDKRSGVPIKDDYAEYLNMLGTHAKHPDGSVGVEAGLMLILQRMQTGRFKVFKHLGDWFSEFRLYHRKDGQVVKERDDLLDATRYAMMMLRYAEPPDMYETTFSQAREEADRDEDTGY